MKIGNLKSIKSKLFKFEKGQRWDGDEEIFEHIEDLLLEDGEIGGPSKVKQTTYIIIQGAIKSKEKQK